MRVWQKRREESTQVNWAARVPDHSLQDIEASFQSVRFEGSCRLFAGR